MNEQYIKINDNQFINKTNRLLFNLKFFDIYTIYYNNNLTSFEYPEIYIIEKENNKDTLIKLKNHYTDNNLILFFDNFIKEIENKNYDKSFEELINELLKIKNILEKINILNIEKINKSNFILSNKVELINENDILYFQENMNKNGISDLKKTIIEINADIDLINKHIKNINKKYSINISIKNKTYLSHQINGSLINLEKFKLTTKQEELFSYILNNNFTYEIKKNKPDFEQKIIVIHFYNKLSNEDFFIGNRGGFVNSFDKALIFTNLSSAQNYIKKVGKFNNISINQLNYLEFDLNFKNILINKTADSSALINSLTSKKDKKLIEDSLNKKNNNLDKLENNLSISNNRKNKLNKI